MRLYDDATARGETFIAPPYFLAEVSSAVYKQLRRDSVSLDDALSLIDEARALAIVQTSPPGIERRAFEIAARFRMKWIYDAFYVALAEIVGCDLWTADEKLHETVRAAFPNVRLLTDYSAATA